MSPIDFMRRISEKNNPEPKSLLTIKQLHRYCSTISDLADFVTNV